MNVKPCATIDEALAAVAAHPGRFRVYRYKTMGA